MYGYAGYTIAGTCCADPEYSTLTSGQKRCVIAIVVNTPVKKDDGSFEERASWFRVAFFGKAAERKSLEWCRKGTPVFVMGEIVSYSYEAEGGKKLTMYNFRPQVIRPMGQKPREDGDEQYDGPIDEEMPAQASANRGVYRTPQGQPPARRSPPPPADEPPPDLPLDDLPDAFS